MKNNIDNLGKKIFEDFSMEKLPDDFTEKLMQKIEESKSLATAKKPLFSRKFLIIFICTFISIASISYFAGTSNIEQEPNLISEKFDNVDINYERVFEFLDFNIEINLFIKLAIITIAILLLIDFLSGRVIDFFIDSPAKVE